MHSQLLAIVLLCPYHFDSLNLQFMFVWPSDRAEAAAVLLPALADLKHAILVKSVLAWYSYVIPLGNCVLGLVSRIPLGTAPAKEI